MKKLLITSLFILLIPQTAAAETNVNISTSGNSDVNVKSESQGEITTCVNGNCTTTGGGGKATVCINGKCTESTDGNIEINENNGNTKVNIKTSSGNNTTIVTTAPTEKEATDAADNKDKTEENQTFIEVVVSVVSGVIKTIISIF